MDFQGILFNIFSWLLNSILFSQKCLSDQTSKPKKKYVVNFAVGDVLGSGGDGGGGGGRLAMSRDSRSFFN